MKALLLAILIPWGAATMNEESEGRQLPVGLWGGAHIGLEVADRGAHLEFDCAHGEIDGKIVLDRKGGFKIAGNYVEERGGPVRAGADESGSPVWYVGQLTGNRLKLTIRRRDNNRSLGTYSLRLGQEPMVVKCR